MLTDALRVMVNNPFKESFYGKRKRKKQLMFIISHILSIFFKIYPHITYEIGGGFQLTQLVKSLMVE